MSAFDLKREVEQLTPEERRELISYMHQLDAPAVPAQIGGAGRKMSSDEAMDYVFDNFDGLLHKLAQ
jgi:hypothetical protein